MKRSEKFPGEEELHRQRCACDPMYQLCFFATENDFSLQFFNRCVQVIFKKYGSALSQDPFLLHVIDLLRKHHQDSDIMTFVILFMIRWESELSKVMEDTMDLHSTHTLFNRVHFRNFLQFLMRITDETCRFPFNKTNMIQRVQDFRMSAVTEYMTGPHLPRN